MFDVLSEGTGAKSSGEGRGGTGLDLGMH